MLMGNRWKSRRYMHRLVWSGLATKDCNVLNQSKPGLIWQVNTEMNFYLHWCGMVDGTSNASPAGDVNPQSLAKSVGIHQWVNISAV